MKKYHGYRDQGFVVVQVVNGDNRSRPLDPRIDIVNHSPTGFEYAYGGSGPAQLAIAILMDALGDRERAYRLYQMFKWEKIATLKQDKPFTITIEEVLEWVNKNEFEEFRDKEKEVAGQV